MNHGGQWAPNARDWKTTFSVGPGYRRDRQKFICPADQSAYYYRDFNTVLASSSLVFSWERLLLKFAADYGWLVNGELDSKFSPKRSFARGKISGPENGQRLFIGHRWRSRLPDQILDLWKRLFLLYPRARLYHSHFNAFPRGTSSATVSSDTTTNWIVFTMTRPIQQDWFGPYAEGRIAFAWKDAWRCDFYYQYIPIHFRQTFTSSIDDFNALLFSTATLSRESDKGKSTRTQLGGADIPTVPAIIGSSAPISKAPAPGVTPSIASNIKKLIPIHPASLSHETLSKKN